jgi:hypothetical protein
MATVEGSLSVRKEEKVKHYFIQDVYSVCVYITNCMILTELYRNVVMNLPLLHPHYSILYPSDAGSSNVLAVSNK